MRIFSKIVVLIEKIDKNNIFEIMEKKINIVFVTGILFEIKMDKQVNIIKKENINKFL
tara:strand:- start:1551 stop:1724 length:174 start_codon:yes stop_codon:yes gene_type:complete